MKSLVNCSRPLSGHNPTIPLVHPHPILKHTFLFCLPPITDSSLYKKKIPGDSPGDFYLSIDLNSRAIASEYI